MITEQTARKIGQYLPEIGYEGYNPDKHFDYLNKIEELIATKCRGKLLLRNFRDFIHNRGLEHGILTDYRREGDKFIAFDPLAKELWITK